MNILRFHFFITQIGFKFGRQIPHNTLNKYMNDKLNIDSEKQKSLKLKSYLNITINQATFLCFAVTYQVKASSFEPDSFKDRVEFGGKVFQTKSFKKYLERLDKYGFISKEERSRRERLNRYYFKTELVQYVKTGDEAFLELYVEKNNILNHAHNWFSKAYFEKSNEIANDILEEISEIKHNPILEQINRCSDDIHSKVATILLLGAYIDGLTTISLSQLVNLSINVSTLGVKYMEKWSKPDAQIYTTKIIKQETIVNGKVVTVGLSENFVKKFKIARSIVFSQALNSRFYEIIKPDQIEEKRLIYPVEIQKRIDLYFSKISKRSFPGYIVQMKKNKLPQNFTIMIYGESGVGKTELVKQLAKRYDRPILDVKLSELRTMWFGESERLVTILFEEIRQATIELGIEPIVLFNEADGFFQNRATNKSFKNETNTNIVTILLNELEKFEGILIATSNYTNSIDVAFERRFALKLHVPKPDNNTIKELIKDKLKISDNNFIQHISNTYNISPAEIENVKMKSLLLDVMPDDKELIEELIRSECNGWSMGRRNIIGYN